jgi:hypothetical protein
MARVPLVSLPVLYDRELVNSRLRTMEGNAHGHTKGVLLDSLSPLRILSPSLYPLLSVQVLSAQHRNISHSPRIQHLRTRLI